MSFHLIEGTPLASNGALIKAREVADFVDAAALLREAKRIAADATDNRIVHFRNVRPRLLHEAGMDQKSREG